MRNPILKICSIYAIVSVIVLSCKTSVEEPKEIKKELVNETPQIKTDAATPTGGGVMMQGFYWDVPAGGTWWDVIKAKVPAWGASGITAVWLPPVSKAQNGPFSMGYDPFDYYDLGEYNQMGSVETRFGSKTELVSFINQAHTSGLQVYADIVLNHNSGGDLESNPFTGTQTYTKFNPASGKFIRSYFDFHANDLHSFDDGYFGGFPDLCHDKTYVKDWLYNRTDAVAKYYKNIIGFDGWRFDYVKGFNPNVVKEWVTATGGFSVGENWDGNAATLKSWVDATGRTSSAFDFACYYKMDEAFDNNDLTKLNG